MSENIPRAHEQEKQPHHHDSAEHTRQHATHEKEHATYEHERRAMLEQAHKTIEQEAVSNKELPVEGNHEVPKQLFVNQELKAISFQRILSRTRKQLSKPERSFSKIVHQPVIDSISRVSEKTIARPSGLLAGGICALIGSSIMLYMAKHYGFRYNLFVFLALFIAGFFIGLLLEVVFNLGRRSRTSTD